MMKRPRYTFADYMSNERIAAEMRARAARVPVFATPRHNHSRFIYLLAAIVFIVTFLTATLLRADPVIRYIDDPFSPCLTISISCTVARAPPDKTATRPRTRTMTTTRTRIDRDTTRTTTTVR